MDTAAYVDVTVLAASCVLGGLAHEDRRAAVKKLLTHRKPAFVSDDELEVAWRASLRREAADSKAAMKDSRLNSDSWLELIVACHSPPDQPNFWSQSTPSTRRAHFRLMFDIDPLGSCYAVFAQESAYLNFAGIWQGESPADMPIPIPMLEDWQDLWRERALVRLEEAWIHRTQIGEPARTDDNNLRDHNWQTSATQDGNPLNIETNFGSDVDLEDILQAMPVILYRDIGIGDVRKSASVRRETAERVTARANMVTGWGCGACGATNKPLLVCSKCKRAKYCSKECQKTAWKTHKKNCQKD